MTVSKRDRASELRLADVEIARIEKEGGLTFKPLRGNRFRCNQVKRMGRLSRTEVGTVRAQYAARLKPTKEPPRPANVRLLVVTRSKLGSVTCPHCHDYNDSVALGVQTCFHCNRRFMVSEAKSVIQFWMRDHRFSEL